MIDKQGNVSQWSPGGASEANNVMLDPAQDSDTLTHTKAMASVHKQEFVTALGRELLALLRYQVFEVVPKESIPEAHRKKALNMVQPHRCHIQQRQRSSHQPSATTVPTTAVVASSHLDTKPATDIAATTATTLEPAALHASIRTEPDYVAHPLPAMDVSTPEKQQGLRHLELAHRGREQMVAWLRERQCAWTDMHATPKPIASCKSAKSA